MQPSPADRATVSRIVRARPSVRHHRPGPVPAELLDEPAELALEAPSSVNLQARSVVIVSGEQGREALTEATGGQPQPQEAPVVLVFVAESGARRAEARPHPGRRDHSPARFAETYGTRP
ncbi:nitroreductase family protein [Streptomyces sp. NPDC058459]|uniref:nitroreductase family protein n=1 Tax=Streptomyces sp. NPDC058459 TaxID=3346508 RepID=UPI00364C760D